MQAGGCYEFMSNIVNVSICLPHFMTEELTTTLVVLSNSTEFWFSSVDWSWG